MDTSRSLTPEVCAHYKYIQACKNQGCNLSELPDDLRKSITILSKIITESRTYPDLQETIDKIDLSTRAHLLIDSDYLIPNSPVAQTIEKILMLSLINPTDQSAPEIKLAQEPEPELLENHPHGVFSERICENMQAMQSGLEAAEILNRNRNACFRLPDTTTFDYPESAHVFITALLDALNPSQTASEWLSRVKNFNLPQSIKDAIPQRTNALKTLKSLAMDTVIGFERIPNEQTPPSSGSPSVNIFQTALEEAMLSKAELKEVFEYCRDHRLYDCLDHLKDHPQLIKNIEDLDLAIAQCTEHKEKEATAEYYHYLAHRVAPNHPGTNIPQAFVTACKTCHRSIITKLLPQAKEINANGDWGIGGALSLAAENGHTDIVKLLLTLPQAKDINADGNWGIGWALSLAARNAHTDIVKLLLTLPLAQHINANGYWGIGGALSWAAENGHTDIVKLLLTLPLAQHINANGNWGIGAALSLAARNGHTEIAQLLLTLPQAQHLNAKGDYSIGSALRNAAINGHTDIVKLLLKLPQAQYINPNGDYSIGEALYQAELHGHTDIAQLLLKLPQTEAIEPNEECSIGAALRMAANQGHTDIVKLLLGLPQAQHINANGAFGIGSALRGAARNGHTDIVKLLLELPQTEAIEPNGDNGIGGSLFQAAINGHTDIAQLLLELPQTEAIEPNGDNGGIGESLFQAAINGHTDIVKLLLELPQAQHINPNGKYSIGAALSLAAGHDTDIVKLLLPLPQAKDINPNGDYSIGAALSWATRNGHTDIVKLLLGLRQSQLLNAHSIGEALYWAADQGHTDIAQLLLTLPQIPYLLKAMFYVKNIDRATIISTGLKMLAIAALNSFREFMLAEAE